MNTEVAQEKQYDVERIETPLDIARGNFEKWNEALQSKDPAIVSALYTESASFLPTMEVTKSGRAEAEQYFVHFLDKLPLGTITEDTVQQITNDTIVHSGLYDFELGPENNRSIAHARFTFVWTQIDGSWKILHHHSSVVPQ